MPLPPNLSAEEILRAIPDGILVVDRENRILAWTGGAERIFGYTAEEAIGRQASFLHSPRFQAAVGDAVAEETNEAGLLFAEAPMLRKDGTPITIQVLAQPALGEAGEVQFLVGVNRDVTERRARLAVEPDSLFERNIAESIPQIVWTATPSGEVDYCNQHWIRYTGLTWEETRDWTWRTAIHPEDLAASVENWRGALEKGVSFEQEQRVRRSDGAYRWHLTRALPLRTADGQIVRWLGTMTDIDDQKADQERAREALAQLRVILDGVADGVLVYDRFGRYAYANEVGARMSGFATAADMLATAPEVVLRKFEMFDEAGDPFPLDRLPGNLALAGDRQPPDAVMQFRFVGEADTRWSIISARPIFDERGTVIYAVTIFRGFTERKRHEIERERLLAQLKRQEQITRLLDEATRELTSSLDYEATLQRVADMAVESLGGWVGVSLVQEDGSLREFAVAHPNRELIPLVAELREKYPNDPETSAEQTVIRTGQPHFIPEIPVEMIEQAAKDARHLELLRALGLRAFISVPLQVQGGRFGLINFASTDRAYDDTDLKMAEELAKRASLAIENARLYRQAQDAIRVRDEFLSIASHELKTPLTPLRLQVQNLQRALHKGGGVEVLPMAARVAEVAEKQVNRLTRLIDDLLDVSRISAGRLSLNREEFSLADLLHEIDERYQATVAQGGGTLKLEVNGALVGRWDRLRLEQVIVNLIMNAVKYAPGSEIRVRAAPFESGVRISVRDQGPGISPLDQVRIFERFERVNATGQVAGLGLGLFISRQIIEAHGGTLEVVSAPGEGADFRISVP